MKLVLVRHGESEHNIKEIMQGHIPSELTKNGITQAKKGLEILKEYFNLDEEEIDCVLNHGSSAQPKTEIGKKFRYADGLSMFYLEMKELFVESGEEEQLRKMFEKYKEAYADNKKVLEILERLYIS